MTHLPRLRLLLLSAVILGAGCNKDESAIRTYTAPNDPPAPRVAAAEPPSADQGPTVDEENATPPLTWTLPAGWKKVAPGNALQYAAFQISVDDPKAQVTIVPLRSAAVLGNLQRWAGQLKLPEVTEADIPKYTMRTHLSGQQAYLVDMTGSAATGNPRTVLLAAIILHEDGAWSFTLKAPEPVAIAQRAKFQEFLHSIQFASGHAAEAAAPPKDDQPAALPAEPDARSFKLVKWQSPSDWQSQAASTTSETPSFRVGSGEQHADVTLSHSPAAQFRWFADQINQWRGEVGLGPVTDPGVDEMHPIDVAGRRAELLLYSGKPEGSGPERRIVVVMFVEGRDVWFLKMVGGRQVVSGQQGALEQFLASLQFEPESK